MNREEVIELAREAGWTEYSLLHPVEVQRLEKFANLVAAAEREACRQEMLRTMIQATDTLRAELEQAEPVAWQDTANLTELVAAEDWENIDPAWHWMYRPLYAVPKQAELDAVQAEREAIIQTVNELTDDRHPMFAEGYRHALQHIKEFIVGRQGND
jgi:hypothetical protein